MDKASRERQRNRHSHLTGLGSRFRQAKWPWSGKTGVVNLHRSPIYWKSDAL
jgi:hypothetical protein